VGVLLVSHNLGDVKAVADWVAVLRLGRNNGYFDVNLTSHEQMISAITGATEHAVTQRRAEAEELEL
jgi:D-xylose transport system ATP-binding protein